MRSRLGLFTLAVIFAALLFATIVNNSPMTSYVDDKPTLAVTTSFNAGTTTHSVKVPVILPR